MKKLLLITLISLTYFPSQSQNVYLLGYGGALTGSQIYPVPFEARIKGDWCYGAGLEVAVPVGSIVLSWTGSAGKFESPNYNGTGYQSGAINTNYYQLGFEKNLRSGSVRPHTIFTLGATQFSPEKTSEEWLFSTTFGLGLKADVNEKVTVRIQAKGNLPLTMGGAGVFCSFGGCAPNLYFNPVVFQGEFTAGLALKVK